MEKYHSMKMEQRTDRSNLSAKWNHYIRKYDIHLVVNHNKRGKKNPNETGVRHVMENLIQFINFNNEVVAGSIIIENPDRLYQYMLIPREKAEMILVLGMV